MDINELPIRIVYNLDDNYVEEKMLNTKFIVLAISEKIRNICGEIGITFDIRHFEYKGSLLPEDSQGIFMEFRKEDYDKLREFISEIGGENEVRDSIEEG